MAKKLIFPTISFGSEPPLPDAGQLAGWVSTQWGKHADMTSYLLEAGLIPQQEAGINMPCAGGKFYGERWLESISGHDDGSIIGDLEARPGPLHGDTMRINGISGACRLSLPAPHLLGLVDRYYGDDDEASGALFRQYLRLFRAGRDMGITGHVLLCGQAVPEEMEALAGRRVFFFPEKQDSETIEVLLEYQDCVAVRAADLIVLVGHREEYSVRQVIITDPAPGDLTLALQYFDPDQIQVGGYCAGEAGEYWKSLAGSATISR